MVILGGVTMVKVSKVTISLPTPLLEYVDRAAAEQETTRSGVIARLVEDRATSEREALAIEGYREMAVENLRLADEGLDAAWDVWGRNAD
jgi:metal-responsive CopG/Arc/MetJ family transcriptional regulator